MSYHFGGLSTILNGRQSNSAVGIRAAIDFEPIPPEITKALLDYLGISHNRVWDCACDRGDISKVLFDYGCEVKSTDSEQNRYGESGIDFLKVDLTGDPDWIITAPPFELLGSYIQRTISHGASQGTKTAFLLRTPRRFRDRRDMLIEKYKPSKVLTIGWQPQNMIVNKEEPPEIEYQWFVWDNSGIETLYETLDFPEVGESLE